MFEFSNNLYNDPELQKEMYGSKNPNVVLHRINGLDIPFSTSWKKIGVNLSGGADSACLTFLLCKIIQDNNIDCKVDVITHIRCWDTRPWQEPISEKVFNKLKSMFPTIIENRYTNFIAPGIEDGVAGKVIMSQGRLRSGDQIQVDEFNSYCIFKYKFDGIFNATTHNPFDLVIEGEPLSRRIDVEKKKPLLVLDRKGSHVFLPFLLVDKSWILAQYYLFKITDLYETTRSCEGDLSDSQLSKFLSDLAEYKAGQYVPICGKCFWCQERAWAEAQIPETVARIPK
jgi:hypothetical protein